MHEISGLIPTLKNQLQPANRLPPEILSHIVQYIPHEYTKDTKPIIPMTHVCRHWRHSIILDPQNWTRISSRRLGLAKLSLERSKAAPLELWLSFPQRAIALGFFRLMTPYIQNTKVLTVHPCSAGDIRKLRNILHATPNLRSLSLLVDDVESHVLDWSNDPFPRFAAALTYLYLSMNIPLYPSFLRLRTLTNFTMYHHEFNLHLDVLLDFLEENLSLEHTALQIVFGKPSLRNSQRRVPIKNRLRALSISSTCAADTDALISKIAVQKGAHLQVGLLHPNVGSSHIQSVISTAHLSNIPSPTSMEYCPDEESIRTIQLLGPNGSFSFDRWPKEDPLFDEFSFLPLKNIRTFHLNHRMPICRQPDPVAFPSSALPVLETLVIKRESAVSHILSALFSDPSSSPLLKTLAFLDCRINHGFMEELTRFSSNRKKTTSAQLHRVVIVNSKGELPPFALIDELWKHVPVVDVRVWKELPSDLEWKDPDPIG